MLGNKDGVAPIRGLLAVSGWKCRGESGSDEIRRMAEHHVQTPGAQVLPLPFSKSEAAPKGRMRQPMENLVQISH
jgi:hypothetical protein